MTNLQSAIARLTIIIAIGLVGCFSLTAQTSPTVAKEFGPNWMQISNDTMSVEVSLEGLTIDIITQSDGLPSRWESVECPDRSDAVTLYHWCLAQASAELTSFDNGNGVQFTLSGATIRKTFTDGTYELEKFGNSEIALFMYTSYRSQYGI